MGFCHYTIVLEELILAEGRWTEKRTTWWYGGGEGAQAQLEAEAAVFPSRTL